MGDNLLGMIYDVSDSDSDVSDMIMLDMLSKLRDDTSGEESNESGDNASDTDDRYDSSYSGASSARGLGDWHKEPIPDPHCSVCSKDITGFVFVCVQCSVRICGACDARGHHAAHYVLRVPAGRPETELRAVVGQVRKAIVSAGLALNTAQPEAKDSEETHDEETEIKTEIKVEVEMEEDEDPLGSSEYDEPYPPASGSQVVPEPAKVKSEPSDDTHTQTQSPISSAPSRRQSTGSVDSDDSQPLAKKRRAIDENAGKSLAFPKQATKTDAKQPDHTISTSERTSNEGDVVNSSYDELGKVFDLVPADFLAPDQPRLSEVTVPTTSHHGSALDPVQEDFLSPDQPSLWEVPLTTSCRQTARKSFMSRGRARRSFGGRTVVGRRGTARRYASVKLQTSEPLTEVFMTDDDIPADLIASVRSVSQQQESRMERSFVREERGGEGVFGDAKSGEVFSKFEWSSMDSFLPVEEAFKPQRTGPTEHHSTPYSAFRSYWDDEILHYIVQEANKTASNNSSSTFQAEWVPTNIHEILVLFSFWMMLGIVRMPSYKSCFSTSPLLETTVFRRMFTRRRYELLVRVLHFVDNPAEEVYVKVDQMHRTKPILTHLNLKFQANYTPSKDICIGESLIMWKGRLDIMQYIRSKAAKNRTKTFELCESATGYLWSFLVNVGRHSSCDTGRSRLQKSTVVLKLMEPLLHKGYRLFLDSRFNSPLLCRFLKRNGTDCVGTLRPNRQHVPPLIDLCTLKQGQVVGRHSGDICVMAWQDNKKVTTISTCHGIAQGLATVSSTPSKQIFKPQVVLDYSKYMGGVDLKDQMLEPYQLERKRWKDWHMKLLKWLLNCSIHNARILVQSSTGQHQDNADFRLSIVDAILSAHLPLCPVSRTQQIVRYNLPPLTHNPYVQSHWLIRLPQTPADAAKGRQSRKQCFECTRYGRKDRKSPYKCEQCDVPLCVEGCFKSFHLSSFLYPQSTHTVSLVQPPGPSSSRRRRRSAKSKAMC